jgi:F-type H+-transporting ATPase subunit delta
MITAKRVDIRYATALLQLAKERGVEEAVYNDALELRALAVSNSDFKNFLKSPNIKASQKAHILQVLFKDVLNELSLGFLLLLLKKARVASILNIATAYIRMYRDEKHIKTVTLYTEKTLNTQQKQAFEAALSREMPGETIDLRPQTYPGLIGGFALRYDDYLYNASIGKKIRNFHLKLESNIYQTQI